MATAAELNGPKDERGYTGGGGPGIPTWAALGADVATDDPPELRYPTSVRTFHIMRRDAQLDALTQSVFLPVRRLNWKVKPNGATDEQTEQLATDLNLPIVGTEEAPGRGRKRFNHDDHLRHTLLAGIYGHMFFNQVPNTKTYDLATDGWRLGKLAPRMPQTIEEILVAPDGGLDGIVQFPQPGMLPNRTLVDRRDRTIPVGSLVAYVWDREGANWTGRSWFHSCFRPWLRKDRLLRIDLMRHEKYGLGIPIGQAPTGASPAAVQEYKKMAQDVRADPRGGVGLPAGADLRVGGLTNPTDIMASVRLDNEEMARKFLAMFMVLGQTETGSRALGDTFLDFFSLSLDTVCTWYATTTNVHVIEDYVDWNWGIDANAPLLVWEDDDNQPLAIADLVALIDAGVIQVDDELENWIRASTRLPDRDPTTTRERPQPPPPVIVAPPGVTEPAPEPEAVAASGGGRRSRQRRTQARASGREEWVRAHLPGQHNQKDHGKGGSFAGFASTQEHTESMRMAEAKIKNAPVPTGAEVRKARGQLDKAKSGQGRAGGDARGGSAASRRKQRENLFNEWGGRERGYVVDPHTGLKMHHTDDPKLNPNGYPKFERGKIFVKWQGGGYQLANLIPESFAGNRSRNDKTLRSENIN